MRAHAPLLLIVTLLLSACGATGGNTPGEPSPTAGQSTPAATAPIVVVTRATPAAATTTGRAIGTRPATPGATASPSRATPRPANAATASIAAAPPLVLGAAPWTPGERTSYAIQARDTGQQVGQATFVIGREFDAEALTASITIGQTQDRFQIGFNTKTFRPTSENRNVSTAQGTFDIRAEYHEGGATIEVTSPGGIRRAELTLPPVYYANDQFLFLLRALPFATGYRGFLSLVPSQGNPPTIPTTVTVLGQETIATPLGPIRAWQVEADFDGARQRLWYSVEAPHYLVKYDTNTHTYLLSETRKP